ncbi:MAG: ABC transporter permease [Myxococcota bacterium]|nr:ABC transporter permease [Myxococcota bacterium]MDP6242391.1 ABC transporter permease [Myxococcota bacterium]MDP7076506.1 ABC transporter permease [Myxococcota bacterium]MDP7300138.1 ABC transporter permease [Myxococcota bacterium]MDP7432933.1 ABC transporter permease [Myxococcota bacterium]
MDAAGYLELGVGAVRSHRLRSMLSVLGIAIGIAAVILLTSIGEGTRRYMLAQFTQFGTNILGINPGKIDTLGIPGVFGGTTHKLTLDDAESIRRIPGIEAVAPVALGQARVAGNGRGRSVFVYGATPDLLEVLKFQIGQGSFLPPGDPRRGSLVAVLGPKLKRELFGEANALGRFVRVADTRLRVIGIMAPKGTLLGMDFDDVAYVPVTTAMRMFNLDEVQEIDVSFAHEGLSENVAENVRDLLVDRHGGREDFTITTQTEMLRVFHRVMDAVTATVAAIAAISLLVGAIGVFTMMWITVGERVGEIGLLRAVGATAREIHGLFLFEAVVLTVMGGALGVLAGLGIALVIRLAAPGLPLYTPIEYVVAALTLSAVTGMVAGVLPARRAAQLHPVEALRGE